MQVGNWSKRAIAAASLLTLISATATRADDTAAGTDVSAELKALKTRISELESKQNENWMTDERSAQIRSIVQDVLKDAKTRGQFADGPDFGYKDGFFIESADKNFKLVIGGYAQIRYESAFSNATNNRSFSSRTLTDTSTGTGTVNQTVTKTTPSDPGNSAGFDIRRARITLAGNVLTPDLTFKLEGDFYGNSTGQFSVTDAYVAYRFNDLFKIKGGSYKVPFAKAELTADPLGTFSERAEVLSPFDPVRSLGVSVYGDIIPTKLGYEIAINDGGKANTLRQDDTVDVTKNLDNRLGAYARLQWAGNGKISDFADEADLRTENQDFIWMLGGAVGYESQNATNNAFPSPQSTTTVAGLSSDTSSGFASTFNLNGDIYRGTMDLSAKWQGLSVNTAAYIQQVNANPGNTSGTSATKTSTGPFGSTDSSFFQWGGYAQAGYFVIPQKLELTGRAGLLVTEGYPNYGEFYSVGANYYMYGQNLKLQTDVTYTPEAAYTDSAAGLLQNTSDVIFRVQLQIKF